jgi:homoserine O-succinyltransferase
MLIESRAIKDENAGPNVSFDPKALAAMRAGLQIDVGLVNNMPDSALKQTERQFRTLLELAAGDQLCVRMHFLSLGGVARGAEARSHMRGRYVDVAEISDLGLDALIVTGAEPRAKSLRDETYWRDFTQLMDWAERNTVSTICSCLAAHAAVLYFDGVERRRMGGKCSGVFDNEIAQDHPLTRNLPAGIATPHSRYNEVREDDLRKAGYVILTRSRQAGVDLFVKERNNCSFVFFQGHPEYESCTLQREYRRDVLRYLHGERDDYPSMPSHYFTLEQQRRLSQFEARVTARRSPDHAAALPLPVEGVANVQGSPHWTAGAAAIYRNWLNAIVEAKRRAGSEWQPIKSWFAE